MSVAPVHLTNNQDEILFKIMECNNVPMESVWVDQIAIHCNLNNISLDDELAIYRYLHDYHFRISHETASPAAFDRANEIMDDMMEAILGIYDEMDYLVEVNNGDEYVDDSVYELERMSMTDRAAVGAWV